MYKDIDLNTLNNGEFKRQFIKAYNEATQNIMDENYKPSDMRKIVGELKIIPNNDLTGATIKTRVYSVLPKTDDVSGLALISTKGGTIDIKELTESTHDHVKLELVDKEDNKEIK